MVDFMRKMKNNERNRAKIRVLRLKNWCIGCVLGLILSEVKGFVNQ